MKEYSKKLNTPLYNTLLDYAENLPARYHMPGHKGRPLFGEIWGDMTALDVTELPQTGDVYRETDGAIRESERLLAKTYNAEHAMLLTGGATQGIFAMLAACTNPGDTVLTDRLCHQSVIYAAALLDLRLEYISRKVIDGIALPIEPDDIPLIDGAKAAIITSPTYNGVLSSLDPIYSLCRQNNIRLLVDAAHGAHLPFIPGFCDYYHYDTIVMSAHKTLPALGQAAFLLTRRSDINEHRKTAMFTGTSSPSYPIMASIDLARAFLDEQGYRRGELLLNAVSRYRYDNVFSGCMLDPLRITAKCNTERLRDIVPEMNLDGMLTFIISLYDNACDVERLFSAIAESGGEPFKGKISRMPAAKFAISPREAMLKSKKIVVPSKYASGHIAAEPVIPYPPGIPVIMPGEIISDEHTEHMPKQITVIKNS
jgi:lysine decarboxylase